MTLLKFNSITSDLIKIFEDTDSLPLEQNCNISFLTFLLANYTPECIKEDLPGIYNYYKDSINI